MHAELGRSKPSPTKMHAELGRSKPLPYQDARGVREEQASSLPYVGENKVAGNTEYHADKSLFFQL
jgi:hypothetical protein